MIQRFSFALFLLTAALTAAAQEHSILTTPTIQEVTVFLNRAQVQTSAPVSLQQGTTEVRLQNQTAYLDPQSIQVSGKGDFTILSVVHEKDYIKEAVKSAKVQLLEDSIEHYAMLVDYYNQGIEILNKEEQLIMANQNIKGQNTNLTAKELSDMANFFRDRMDEIREEIIDNKVKIKKFNLKLNAFTNQLREYNKNRNHPSSTIIVTVSAKNAISGTLNTNYITANAGWYPLYDLRAKDIKSPVQLSYKAQVYQNTGYEWKNVHITLSTSNPAAGGTKPELSNWYLDIYDPSIKKYKTARVYDSAAPMMKSSEIDIQQEAELSSNAGSAADYTTEVVTTLSVQFDIALTYTIVSGGKGQQVDIKNIDLPALYEYAAVPKLDLTAFLLARIINWDGFNILSGDANVYFEGTYVGKTYIDASNASDTLNISLGRDPRIVVERNLIKDFSSKKFIGANRKEEYGYELVIRNTKKDPITIAIEDQYPISKNNQLEVELIETSGAVNNATTGTLTWRTSIEAAETKKITLKYAVKYPKDKKVNGL